LGQVELGEAHEPSAYGSDASASAQTSRWKDERGRKWMLKKNLLS